MGPQESTEVWPNRALFWPVFLLGLWFLPLWLAWSVFYLHWRLTQFGLGSQVLDILLLYEAGAVAGGTLLCWLQQPSSLVVEGASISGCVRWADNPRWVLRPKIGQHEVVIPFNCVRRVGFHILGPVVFSWGRPPALTVEESGLGMMSVGVVDGGDSQPRNGGWFSLSYRNMRRLRTRLKEWHHARYDPPAMN